MEWRSRIVDYGTERPDQLLANPRNWRIHPKDQQDALEAALDRVGWVKNVIVNRTTGAVVDGHLRVGLAISREEEEIPVVYVELSEDEERAVIATLDPLSGLAEVDQRAYEGLVEELRAPSEGNDLPLSETDAGASTLLDILAELRPVPVAPLGGTNGRVDRSSEILAICPGCGHEWPWSPRGDKEE